MQKNAKPEIVEFKQQDYMRPERLKRKGATTASTGIHTISRRQDTTQTQIDVLSDIARTFNECLCGIPSPTQKGNQAYTVAKSKLKACTDRVA